MINETGNRYGRLTVICYDHTDAKRGAYWKCVCDCGLTTVVKGNSLRSGKTKSCGCLIREHARELGNIYGKQNVERLMKLNKTEEHRAQAKAAATVHGGTGTRLFKIWSCMRERCNSTKGDHAKWYHDKGIRVCEEWENDFPKFREWAYENGYVEQPKDTQYKDKLSIDRIDPNKGYSPENCRWVTVSENSRLRNQYHANQR